MGTVLLVLVVVLVVAALIFGVVTLLTGEDPGLGAAEPDGRAAPLPNNRSLTEDDIKTVRFDVTWRGYRMTQVDRILRRTAYDVGYKNEMIAVLEAEVIALREGRAEDADLLRKAREAAANTNPTPAASYSTSVLAAGWEDPEDELDDEGPDGGPEVIGDEPDQVTDDVLDPTAPGRLAHRANGQAATNGQAQPIAEPAVRSAAAEPVAEPADTQDAGAADTEDTDTEDTDTEDTDTEVADPEDADPEDADEEARDASDSPSARA